jgi:secondary thiamine-phosphate synthase enzyme
MPTLSVASTAREAFIDLTAELRALVQAQGWREGAVLLICPHTTAGLTINEGADPDVRRDLLVRLRRLAPAGGVDRHAEGNSDAHLKASLMGSSVLVPLEGGRLLLGTWQAVYFCEFDGPRQRQVQASLLRG